MLSAFESPQLESNARASGSTPHGGFLHLGALHTPSDLSHDLTIWGIQRNRGFVQGAIYAKPAVVCLG